MKFKKGQIIRLINNTGMGIPVGTLARVLRGNYMGWGTTEYVGVEWLDGCQGIRGGPTGYYIYRFELVFGPGEQLMFEFMYGQETI